MAGSNQYRDYIKRSFLRFAFSIIALLFVLVGLFLFINVQLISAGGNRKNNARLGAVLDKQVKAYEEGLLRFGSDYRIVEALKDRDSGRVTEVNRLLYDLCLIHSLEMEVIQNSYIWDIIPDHTPVRLGVQPAKINVFNQEGTKSLIVRREHA